MTTSDDCTTDTERPLKVVAIRAEVNGTARRIMDIVDVLDGEKGIVSLKIMESVTIIAVQRYTYKMVRQCTILTIH